MRAWGIGGEAAPADLVRQMQEVSKWQFMGPGSLLYFALKSSHRVICNIPGYKF